MLERDKVLFGVFKASESHWEYRFETKVGQGHHILDTDSAVQYSIKNKVERKGS